MQKIGKYILCGVLNIFMVYVASALCRVVYVLENWNLFSSGISGLDFGNLLQGAFIFDTSAIAYINILYLVLFFLPLYSKENAVYHRVLRLLFVVLNSLMVLANVADSVYYPYTGKRTTVSVFAEFANENNISGILFSETLGHWYLILAFAAMAWALWRLYRTPASAPEKGAGYYAGMGVCMAASVLLCVVGMRGTVTEGARPKGIRDANLFVDRPSQAAIVLNTPFSLIRSIGHSGFKDPGFFSRAQLDSIYTPVHVPCDSLPFSGKNVVVFITESLGREYIGFYNRDLDSGTYKGYTPFLDSLISESLTFRYSFANGRKSIDAMPSILSSLPMMEHNFFTSAYISNTVGGLSVCLRDKGYYTSFFHGADNGSMGFDAFSKSIKYKDYFGRDEYGSDPDFDGDADYDGRWAIWDHKFMQFWEKKLAVMPEPFMSTIFTATSHNPYKIPPEFADVYPEGPLPIHKCIRYVDDCFRQFFDFAKLQPWYYNTIFVITGDHTNQTDHAEYQTDMGYYCSPIVVFDPSRGVPAGMRDAVAQQIDVMPTVLGILHYDEPYVAFGKDLTGPDTLCNWAYSYVDGTYQYVLDEYLLQFDGISPKALYNYRDDWMLTRNIMEGNDSVTQAMTTRLKALMQSYLQRMIENNLTIGDKANGPAS